MRRFPGQVLLLSRWKVVLLVAAALGATAAAGVWAYAATREGTANVVQVRWGNVSIEAPVPSGADDVRVVQEWYSPGMYSPDFSGDASTPSVPAIRLAKGEGTEASWVVVDANTGEILFEQVRADDRAAFDAVLATVRVEGERASVAPWPYGTALPATARESWGNITYLEPDPASGIVVRPGIADFGPEGPAKFLIVSSANSSRHINAETGEIGRDSVDERDREAFDRFMSEVRVGEQEGTPSPTPTQSPDLKIYINPPETVAVIGASFSVEVGVEHASNLGSFEFVLDFDASVIDFDGFEAGPFLGSTGRSVMCSTQEWGAGSQQFGCASGGSQAGPDGSGVLATVLFEATAVGGTGLDLHDSALYDATADVNPVVHNVEDGHVTVP